MMKKNGCFFEYKKGIISNIVSMSVDKDNDIIYKPKTKHKPRTGFYNFPVSFDIETTSTYVDEKKCATMYIWQFGIKNYVIYGRTWEEYENAMYELTEALETNSTKIVTVWVQNLSYEMQFIRKRHTWTEVFTSTERSPIYAITTTGIMFRDSLILSGLSLEKMGEGLRNHEVRKMVGDLDYYLPRHSCTPLTEEELGYCENDIRVLNAYIEEKIQADGDITKIPLTNTGYVRKLFRQKCIKKDNPNKDVYIEMIKNLKINGIDEYNQLKRAFHGGFTHASAYAVNRGTIEDVTSWDFTSSYPTVMVTEKFPMTSGLIYNIKSKEEFLDHLKNSCCVFDIAFINIRPKVTFEHPISFSKIWDRDYYDEVQGNKRVRHYTDNVIQDNGRIVSADRIKLTITNVDYEVINMFYIWDKEIVTNFRMYGKDYLPTPFVKTLLELYKNKTTLKGVAEQEELYMKSKGMLNSAYGMCVMDIMQDEITYNNETGEWGKAQQDEYKTLEDYNNNKGRFLFYPWGIFVTAYAYRNLFTGIYNTGIKGDYLYSDTDSMKITNSDKHLDYIKKYNENVIEKLHTAMDHHKLPYDLCEPKTIKGVPKPLGVWDFDGHYKKFRCNGAKRYIYTDDNDKLHITIAGVSKVHGAKYLETFDDPFEKFTNNLVFPKGQSGKLTHTYIDDPQDFLLTDYLGNTQECHELSTVHLEEAEFSMKLSPEYLMFLLSL